MIIDNARNPMLRVLAAFIFIVVLMTAAPAAQQGGTTRYVYDDNGRLRAVVSPAGETAIYEYDLAGNFTAIRQLAADALELLDFFPKQGVSGDVVSFIGIGFGAGVNSVSFNGATAQVIEITNTMVTARVPPTATTGMVTINTVRGVVTTAVPFTVRGVRVDPAKAAIFPSETIQFSAVVAVTGSDQSVRWSVNDVDGGNANVGTVTANGFYTAPGQPGVFIVQATSNADASLFAESIVTVQDRSLINTVVAPLLSVRRGHPLSSASSAGVSIRRDATPSNISSAGVSVQRDASPGSVTGASVSATKGPSILSISPGTFTRGTTTAITINGVNFNGATTISFFTVDGVLDSSITISGLKVNGDGNSLVATVMVSAGTATSRRIVIISGSSGSSQLADLGINTLEIVP
jgi:YD repeat-containing protein